jgi:hypothetical protein
MKVRVAPAALLAACLAAGGAVWAQTAGGAPDGLTVTKTITTVIEEQGERLLALPGVVGLAEGLADGKPCVLLLVERRTPELDAQVPANIDGYTVVVKVTGPVRPLAGPPGK